MNVEVIQPPREVVLRMTVQEAEILRTICGANSSGVVRAMRDLVLIEWLLRRAGIRNDLQLGEAMGEFYRALQAELPQAIV